MSKDTSLRSILDKNIDDHKAEIKFIAKNSLPNFQSPVESNVKWETAKIQSSKLKSKSKKKYDQNYHATDSDDFSNRMFMFSLGADEVMDKPFISQTVKKPTLLKSLDAKCTLRELKHDSFAPCGTDSVNHDHQIVDVDRFPGKYSFLSPRYATREKVMKEIPNPPDELLPHYIHPRYQTRYNELLRFRIENIRENDEREQEILAGTGLVRHLENRLKKKLASLSTLGLTPNFHRLQVYTEIFDDLISESWMFKSIFSRIKAAYDVEVERVLEMPVSQKELLQSEMDQLRQSIYNKEKLENIQSEVLQVEDAIKIAVETQNEYENLLTKEEEQLEELIKTKSKLDSENKKLFQPTLISTGSTECEKLEILKTQCWDLMDEISQIQKETKTKMTSRATVNHLTEGLQDVGIEVEKLHYHKNQLESEIEIMKTDLNKYLDYSDISKEDYKLIHSLLDGSTTLPICDYEESNKWSWYIS